MSDDNRAGPETMELADEDRLPWLEAVEEDGNGGGGPSVAKLVVAIVIGLVAIGVVVGGLWWIGNGNRADENTVITAEKGDYKQRPENPGGMNITGEGNTMFAASEGQQPRGNLNVNGVAEAPAAPAQGQTAGQQGAQGQQAGQPARPGPGQQAQAPARPAPAPQQPQRPAPAPAPSGPAIQLGAFSSPAAANNAWRNLAGRFRYLAPLSHHLVAVQSGGRTLHRLRASGPDSANICRRLQAAGEACAIVS